MTSDQLWMQLRHLLQDEMGAYDQLSELLKEEWFVLLKLDYQRLIDVTRRKEDMLTHIMHIENERMACMKQLGEDVCEETSFDWVVKSKYPEALPVKHGLKQLILAGQRVKQLSEKNTGLINRGLHVVREAMNIVHEGLGLQPMYGESGCLMFPSASTSLNVEG